MKQESVFLMPQALWLPWIILLKLNQMVKISCNTGTGSVQNENVEHNWLLCEQIDLYAWVIVLCKKKKSFTEKFEQHNQAQSLLRSCTLTEESIYRRYYLMEILAQLQLSNFTKLIKLNKEYKGMRMSIIHGHISFLDISSFINRFAYPNGRNNIHRFPLSWCHSLNRFKYATGMTRSLGFI